MKKGFSINLPYSAVQGWIQNRKKQAACIAMLLGLMSTGCTALTSPISGIPARRLPPQFFAQPKNNLVPIDVSRLGQEAPRQYLLDRGDVIGVYIEGILPSYKPGETPPLPPVNFPENGSDLPPSVGYPITVLDDGTITLPLLRKPINVRGLTLEQARDLIKNTYLEEKVVKIEADRPLSPILTRLRDRTYNVVVVRQDVSTGGGAGPAGGGFVTGSDQSSKGSVLRLKAGQNDILHALIESGGLPGVNAKNEVKILRASLADKRKRDEFVQQFYSQIACNPNPCLCPPPLPDDPSIIKIPLRLPPGVTPAIRPEDIILEDGDVLYIESRDAEVFYTGGLLQGGEFKIPRDYDIDVLQAMAIAGTGVNAQRGGGGGGMNIQGFGAVPPGMLYILRKTPCNGQVTIEVDLARALSDPRERPLVQAGDTLILRYKCQEEALNFGLGSFFTFGIRQLFRN